MKSNVNDVVAKIKRRIDYDVVDSDLDTLVRDTMSDACQVLRQTFYDYKIYQAISTTASFKMDYMQAYTDPQIAKIVNDTTTFTAVAGDTISVKVDTVTQAVVLTGAVSIANVATLINAAFAPLSPASVQGSGFLQITSPTRGAASVVTMTDTAGTASARLFSVAVDKSQSAITDIDEILVLSERTFKFAIQVIPYSDLIMLYPDPVSITAQVPDVAARWNDLIYFGPTPSKSNTIWVDYLKLITDVATGGIMPFENNYDPVIIAKAKAILVQWLDPSDANAITVAKAEDADMTNRLIIDCAKDVRMNRQTQSRRNIIPYFSPRKVVGPQP